MILSCSNNDSGYWVTPENQNGDISDFYATPEYCKNLSKNCPELEHLMQLEKEVVEYVKQLRSLQSPTKEDNSTLIILEQTDFISNELAYACGGFCANETSLPVLPYRTVDVKAFAEHNLEGFKVLIKKHMAYIESNDSISLSNEGESILTKVDLIKKQNVVGALIKFYEIELQLIEINKTLANIK